MKVRAKGGGRGPRHCVVWLGDAGPLRLLVTPGHQPQLILRVPGSDRAAIIRPTTIYEATSKVPWRLSKKPSWFGSGRPES